MSDENREEFARAPLDEYPIYIRRPDIAKDSPLNALHDSDQDIDDAFDNWKYHQIGALQIDETSSGVNIRGLRLESCFYGNTPDLSNRKVIELFCSAHELGVYPPAAIMNELYRRFKDYIDDNREGKNIRLGEYFGEPSEGTPAAAFRRAELNNLMALACENVHRLRIWFHRSKSEALDIVEIQLNNLQEQLPWASERPKGRAALEKAYANFLAEFWPELKRLCNKYEREAWPCPTDRKILKSFLQSLGRDALNGHTDLQAYLDNFPKEDLD